MIRMQFDGKDEVMRKLAAVGDASARRKIMGAIGAYLEDEVMNRFTSETGPDGQRWQQSIRAREEGGQTLSDTGMLAASIAYDYSADRLEIGSAKPYAAIHQFGGEIKAKNADKLAFKIGGHSIFVDSVTMPARPYLGISNDDEDRIVDIIHRHWKVALQ